VDEKDAGKDRDAPYVEEDAARRLLTGGDAFKTNLWALAYRADKRPLLPGCQCLACTRYMRAYVHHLLQCHEMTAAVLLDVHNYYHFNRFMEAAREAIGDGTWKEFAEFHRERAARLDGDD
jgi:queuine tRNA-ribosyltransferase subunit QTRTD1